MCRTAEWWVALKGGAVAPPRLWLTLVLLSLHSSITAINHTMYVFQAYSPPPSCKVDSADGTSTFVPSCQDECPGGYVFPTTTDSTIVTEWSLVCQRAALRPTMGTVYFVGVALGALVGGMLADRWGRRVVMLGSLAGQAVLGVAVSQAPSLVVYAALRLVQGVFVQALQGSTFTLLVELFPARLRTVVACVLELYWAIGLSSLALLSYLLPRWRDLQLAVAVPAVLALLWVRWIPESRLWLESRGHAPPFRRGLPGHGSYRERPEETDAVETAVVANGSSPKVEVSGKPKKRVELGVKELVCVPGLRVYTFVMVLVWFAVSLSYYGTTFHMPALAGDRHLNFALGAGMEVVAYAGAYLLLSRVGRRLPLALFTATSAASCLAVAVVLGTKTGDGGVAVLVLVLLSKAALTSGFFTIFLYTAELFPTGVRAHAMGLSGFSGRVGNLLAPQILYLGSGGEQWLPLMLMGALLLVTSGMVLMLPETLGRELPATVEDAVMLRVRQRRTGPHKPGRPSAGDDSEKQILADASPPNDTPRHQPSDLPQLNAEDFKVPSWKCDIPLMEKEPEDTTDGTTASGTAQRPVNKVITTIYEPEQTAEELGRSLLESLNRTPEPSDRKPYIETEFVLSPQVITANSEPSEPPPDEYKTTVASAV